MNKYLELILILIFTTIFLIGCGTKYLEYNNSFRTFDSTAYFVNSNNKSKIRIVAKTKEQLKKSLKLVVLSEENEEFETIKFLEKLEVDYKIVFKDVDFIGIIIFGIVKKTTQYSIPASYNI